MSTPAEFIARAFAVRTAAHLAHLRSRSYAEHVALGGFYDALIGLVDSYAEAHQGLFGLIEDEIASGRLVVPLQARMRSDEAYYLCAPRGRGPHRPLEAFRDWLCRVAAAAEEAEAKTR